MKHIRAFGLAAVFSVVCLGALPITAQQKPVDISGAWKFKTDVLPNKGCIISGDIRFTKLAKASDYSCKFVSVENCDRPGGPTFTKVQQSCTAKLEGGDIVITSTIDKIVDAGPAGFKASMFASQAYSPDHFRVHPEKGELRGIFHSSRQAGVRFWRDTDLVG